MKKNQVALHSNVRFWTWGPEGWVKITLRPNQRRAWFTGGPHEEGWSSRLEEWHYDVRDEVIRLEIVDDGCDCDGRLTTYKTLVCPLDQLHSRRTMPNNPLTPAWEEESSRQRDQYAEAAGY